jgi:hypothetical protein
VSLDEFASGRGVFLVKYEGMPALKMADVKAQAGNFAIESVSLKLTGKVTQKKEQYYLGATELVKGADAAGEEAFKKLGEFVTAKKTMLVVSGVLKEDDKGKQSLALLTVGELDKKGK